MRVFLAFVTGTVLLAAAPAHAENRTFLIANDASGYGVDRCLADGSRCGQAIASSYCRAREFARAVSFRRIERSDTTSMVATGHETCQPGLCEALVAIECSR